MIIRNHAAQAIGVVFSISGSIALALPHAPIVINGDTQFTAANGVSNPWASGTATDPYVIPNLKINGNRFEQFYGAPGGNGAPGGDGGGGGIAAGIYSDNAPGLNATTNIMSSLYGGVAGNGGAGNGGAGNGGAGNGAGNAGINGGYGGMAVGLWVTNTNTVSAQSNTIQFLAGANGGNGGNGGAGAFNAVGAGGKGGDGNPGGEASALRFDNVHGISNLGNILHTLFGGRGGSGGRGGFGNTGTALGGKGGDGGPGAGIHYFQSSAYSHPGNAIANNRGGAGGSGGVVGGANGLPGSSLPILSIEPTRPEPRAQAHDAD